MVYEAARNTPISAVVFVLTVIPCIRTTAATPFNFDVRYSPSQQFDVVIDAVGALLSRNWVSNVTVDVSVEFQDLGGAEGGLATGTSGQMKKIGEYAYTIAMAEALEGRHLNGKGAKGDSGYDVLIRVNPSINWHLEIDEEPRAGEFDLFSVIMHEMLHGLLFQGSTYVRSHDSAMEGTFLGWDGAVAIFDRHLTSAEGCAVLGYVDGQLGEYSDEVGGALTSDNLFFGVNDNSRIPLYSPEQYKIQSSIYHLAPKRTGLFTSRNYLMSPSLRSGFTKHEVDNFVVQIQRSIASQGALAPNFCKRGTYKPRHVRILGLWRDQFMFFLIVGLVVAFLCIGAFVGILCFRKWKGHNLHSPSKTEMKLAI